MPSIIIIINLSIYGVSEVLKHTSLSIIKDSYLWYQQTMCSVQRVLKFRFESI